MRSKEVWLKGDIEITNHTHWWAKCMCLPFTWPACLYTGGSPGEHRRTCKLIGQLRNICLWLFKKDWIYCRAHISHILHLPTALITQHSQCYLPSKVHFHCRNFSWRPGTFWGIQLLYLDVTSQTAHHFTHQAFLKLEGLSHKNWTTVALLKDQQPDVLNIPGALAVLGKF